MCRLCVSVVFLFCEQDFSEMVLICNGVRVETENHASVIKTHRKLEIKAPAVLLEIAAVHQTAWPRA